MAHLTISLRTGGEFTSGGLFATLEGPMPAAAQVGQYQYLVRGMAESGGTRHSYRKKVRVLIQKNGQNKKMGNAFFYQMESQVAAIAQEQRLAPVAGSAGLAQDVKVVERLALVAVPQRGLDLIGAPPLHRDLSDGVTAKTLLNVDSP